MCRSSHFLTIAVLSGAAALLMAGSSEAQFRGFQRRFIQRPAFPANRMPGWDWWRIYPWSPYNYGRNPYNPAWYPYVVPYPVYTPSAAPAYGSDMPAWPQPTYGASDSSQQVLIPDPTGEVNVPPPGAAVIRLYVPDEFADVWFDGVETSSVGTTRYYVTPELDDKPYHYVVTARWRRNGQLVTEERRVDVSPGKTAVVDFTRAPVKK